MTHSSKNSAPILVWFRDDLRVDDNRALLAACATGAPLLCFFCFDGSLRRSLGGASCWWLHHSLARLDEALAQRGSALHILQGDAATRVPEMIRSTGARSIYWNRRYSAAAIGQDAALKAQLSGDGLDVRSFNAHLLYEPWTLKTGSGGPYRVFTPFSRATRVSGLPKQPVPAPNKLNSFKAESCSMALDELKLLPTNPDWSDGLQQRWTPGTVGARKRLVRFLSQSLDGYPDDRNIPGMDATSGLSPHLRFGEISPREVWQAAEVAQANRDSIFKFHQELLWREFSYHLLYHYPDLHEANHQPKFDAFAWVDVSEGRGKEHLRAWQKGLTGYPIVDAGMRELWATGWMHNRVRMVVGSFLVKHLLIDWRHGERWFWDTLVDADPASNAASWQWIAGSGADAAPYFRVFSPMLQGEKFDGDGAYTRRWVPELADMPKKFLHKPWEAPAPVLRDAKVSLGETYPHPIVDHKQARERALSAFKSLTEAASVAPALQESI